MGKVLRIVQGNTFGTAIEINAVDAEGHAVQDFSLDGSTSVRVWYIFAGKEVDVEAWSIDDGKVVILWDGRSDAMRLGTYDIFIEGMFEETAWRNAMKSQFTLVKYNYEAYIPDDVIVLNGIYQLTAQMSLITRVSGGGGTPSQTIPLMDGEASVGEENAYARGDHRHPSDTSKQDVIDASHKLSADLVDDASTTNKFVTAAEKTTWNNKSNFSGSYNDLTNKPTIPAAQVNSDWNAASGVAQILNKPAIPAAQVQSDWNEADNTKADYIKNKPTIPAAQVQSDWNEADNTKADYIKNKPTIPSVVDALNSASTTAALSANQGKVLDESKQNVIDASHKLPYSYISDTPTIPSALSDLSDDSTHRVVTDTEISAWDNKASKVTIVNHGTDDTTYTLPPNQLHIWGTVTSLAITLGTPTDATIENEYKIQFTSGATATQFAIQDTITWGDSCGTISLAANKIYQISITNGLATWESWSIS